eukprot:TRINITY_DN10288_c0_g1_i1.p1 TRINITY_DN10288_c0_g1~~TRINITY_DN10288_c0_g1_i1.p1  ORF type:complete len:2425 (+),score=427.27 TRINITY_DN10288_c0_g1_i1:117-7391(+)
MSGDVRPPPTPAAKRWARLRQGGDLWEHVKRLGRTQREEEEQQGTGERVTSISLPPVPARGLVKGMTLPHDDPRTFLQRVLDATPHDDDRLGWRGSARRPDFAFQGTTVTSVVPGSAAASAGLRVGMELQRVNGAPVASEAEVARAFAQCEVCSAGPTSRIPVPGDRLLYGAPGVPVAHRSADGSDVWRLAAGQAATVESVRGEHCTLQGPDGGIAGVLTAAWRHQGDNAPAQPQNPELLELSGDPAAAGAYTLARAHMLNGAAVWLRDRPGPGCIASTPSGHWLVSPRMGSAQGWLRTAEPHSGRPPSDAPDGWVRPGVPVGRRAAAAPEVQVTVVPPLVPLIARMPRFASGFRRFFLCKVSQDFLAVSFWYVLVLCFRSGIGDARPGVQVRCAPPSPLASTCPCGAPRRRQGGRPPPQWRCAGVPGHRCRPDLGWSACSKPGPGCTGLCQRPGLKHAGVIKEVTAHHVLVDFDAGTPALLASLAASASGSGSGILAPAPSTQGSREQQHGERRVPRDFWECGAEPEYETVVRAQYKEALFDLMAATFAMLCQSVPPLSKDALLAEYADCIAQGLYAAFHATFPFDRASFGEAFQLSLQTNVHFWVTGMSPTHPNVDRWDVTRVYKQKLKAKRPRPVAKRAILAERWDQFAAGHDRQAAAAAGDRQQRRRPSAAVGRLAVGDGGCDLFVEATKSREDAKTTEEIRDDLFFVRGDGRNGQGEYFGQRPKRSLAARRLGDTAGGGGANSSAAGALEGSAPPSRRTARGAGGGGLQLGGWGCRVVTVRVPKQGDIETSIGATFEGVVLRDLDKGGPAEAAGAGEAWQVTEVGGVTVNSAAELSAAFERAGQELEVRIADERGYELQADIGWHSWMGPRPRPRFSLDGSSPLIQHYLTHVVRLNNSLISDSMLDAPEQTQEARRRAAGAAAAAAADSSATPTTPSWADDDDTLRPQDGVVRRLRVQQLVGVPAGAGMPQAMADYREVLALIRSGGGAARAVCSGTEPAVYPHAGIHGTGKSPQSDNFGTNMRALIRQAMLGSGMGVASSPPPGSPKSQPQSPDRSPVLLQSTSICESPAESHQVQWPEMPSPAAGAALTDNRGLSMILEGGFGAEDEKQWSQWQAAVADLSLGRLIPERRAAPETVPRPATAPLGGRKQAKGHDTPPARPASAAAVRRPPPQCPSPGPARPHRASPARPATAVGPRGASPLPPRPASAVTRTSGGGAAARAANLNPVSSELVDPQRCWTPIEKQYAHMSLVSTVGANALAKEGHCTASMAAVPLRLADRSACCSPTSIATSNISRAHSGERTHSRFLRNYAAHSSRVPRRQASISWQTARYDSSTEGFKTSGRAAAARSAATRLQAERDNQQASENIEGQLREMQKAAILLLAEHERELHKQQSSRLSHHQQVMNAILAAMDRARPQVTQRNTLEVLEVIREVIQLIERHLAEVSAEARSALVAYTVRKGFELRTRIRQLRIRNRRDRDTMQFVDRVEREAAETEVDRLLNQRRAEARRAREEAADAFGAMSPAVAAEAAARKQQMQIRGPRGEAAAASPSGAQAPAACPHVSELDERDLNLSPEELTETQILEAAGAIPEEGSPAASPSGVHGALSRFRTTRARLRGPVPQMDTAATPERVREVINALLWTKVARAEAQQQEQDEDGDGEDAAEPASAAVVVEDPPLPDDTIVQLVISGQPLPWLADGDEPQNVEAAVSAAGALQVERVRLAALLRTVREGLPITKHTVREAAAKNAADEAQRQRQEELIAAAAAAATQAPRARRPSLAEAAEHLVFAARRASLTPPAAAPLPRQVTPPALSFTPQPSARPSLAEAAPAPAAAPGAAPAAAAGAAQHRGSDAGRGTPAANALRPRPSALGRRPSGLHATAAGRRRSTAGPLFPSRRPSPATSALAADDAAAPGHPQISTVLVDVEDDDQPSTPAPAAARSPAPATPAGVDEGSGAEDEGPSELVQKALAAAASPGGPPARPCVVFAQKHAAADGQQASQRVRRWRNVLRGLVRVGAAAREAQGAAAAEGADPVQPDGAAAPAPGAAAADTAAAGKVSAWAKAALAAREQRVPLARPAGPVLAQQAGAIAAAIRTAAAQQQDDAEAEARRAGADRELLAQLAAPPPSLADIDSPMFVPSAATVPARRAPQPRLVQPSGLSERFLRSKVVRQWRRPNAAQTVDTGLTQGPVGTWLYPCDHLFGGALGVAVQYSGQCAYQIVEEGGELYFDQKLVQAAQVGKQQLRNRAKLRRLKDSDWEADFAPVGILRLRHRSPEAGGGKPLMESAFKVKRTGRTYHATAYQADDQTRARMEEHDRRELFDRLSGVLDRRGRTRAASAAEKGKLKRHLSFGGLAAVEGYVTWKDTAQPVGASGAELMQRIEKGKKERKEVRRAERRAARDEAAALKPDRGKAPVAPH